MRKVYYELQNEETASRLNMAKYVMMCYTQNNRPEIVKVLLWRKRRFPMGFWIFMLIMDLLIPFTMIGFGRYFIKRVPKQINAVFGYRTSMSMKNKDTWDFAHKYCGRIWYSCGLIMLPVTVIFLLLAIGENEDYVGTVGGIICGVQLIPLMGSVLPTEIALKKNFDKNGKKKLDK